MIMPSPLRRSSGPSITCRWKSVLLVLIACVASPGAHAFYDSFAVVPASPIAGGPWTAAFRSGGCDQPLGDLPVARTITVIGNLVQLEFLAIDNSGAIGFCNFPTQRRTYIMPPLDEGSYRLEFRSVAGALGTASVLRGTVDFVVQGTPSAIGVPTHTRWGLLGMMLAFLLVAWRTRHRYVVAHAK